MNLIPVKHYEGCYVYVILNNLYVSFINYVFFAVLFVEKVNIAIFVDFSKKGKIRFLV